MKVFYASRSTAILLNLINDELKLFSCGPLACGDQADREKILHDVENLLLFLMNFVDLRMRLNHRRLNRF